MGQQIRSIGEARMALQQRQESHLHASSRGATACLSQHQTTHNQPTQHRLQAARHLRLQRPALREVHNTADAKTQTFWHPLRTPASPDHSTEQHSPDVSESKKTEFLKQTASSAHLSMPQSRQRRTRFRRTVHDPKHAQLAAALLTSTLVNVYIDQPHSQRPELHYSMHGRRWRHADCHLTRVASGFMWHAQLPVPSTPPAWAVQPAVAPLRLRFPHDPGGACTSLHEEGHYLFSGGRLQRVLRRPVVLVADVAMLVGKRFDATSIALCRQFGALWRSSRRLVPCTLVYTTHRTLQSYWQVWRDRCAALPSPDTLLVARGGEVWQNAPSHWERDERWHSLQQRHWDSRATEELLQPLLHSFGRNRVRYSPRTQRHELLVQLHVRVDSVAEFASAAAALLDERAPLLRCRFETRPRGAWVVCAITPRAGGVRAALRHAARTRGWDPSQVLHCEPPMDKALTLGPALGPQYSQLGRAGNGHKSASEAVARRSSVEGLYSMHQARPGTRLQSRGCRGMAGEEDWPPFRDARGIGSQLPCGDGSVGRGLNGGHGCDYPAMQLGGARVEGDEVWSQSSRDPLYVQCCGVEDIISALRLHGFL